MSSHPAESFYALHSDACSLVLDCRTDLPVIAYFGPRLSDSAAPASIGLLGTRQEAPAREAQEAGMSLTPLAAAGYLGRPGLLMHRDGTHWNVYATVQNVDNSVANTLIVHSYCSGTQVALTHTLELDPATNVLKATTALTNKHEQVLNVDQCSAPCIPLPDHCNQIMGFAGRWSGEFRLTSQTRTQGSYARENRSGRTSHHAFPGVVVHETNTCERNGSAYGFHLGWSGNHSIWVEELADGRSCTQLGELLYPGEMRLELNETYTSPALYATCATRGFNQMSQHFHAYVRRHLTVPKMRDKQKLVHFNSWEAVYFDLTEEKLFELAQAASQIGAERFVLDDGWFRHRRAPNAGLGDWYVEESHFPEGLHPLATCLQENNLEFGLWLEPEMINPDSDLYRAHPDWALHADPAPKVMARDQLVLDLSRTEVHNYLFERIDAILNEYPITYIKWDMNRDLHQPGNQHGYAVVHAQTLALYRLLERIRSAHPAVEIESCSSGGGRADFGILHYTDRIWTSDSNDALDRLAIQKGFSLFFPSEFMGAHVGPAECHITGRKLSMDLRAGVALFGDMGVEANLLEIDEQEQGTLKKAIELHKQHRMLIFSGNLVRLDRPDHEHAFGIVANNYSEALFSYTLLRSQPHSLPGRLRFDGLEPDTHYEISLVWPETPLQVTPSILEHINGAQVSGGALMQVGMQLPLMHPESQLVFYLRRV